MVGALYFPNLFSTVPSSSFCSLSSKIPPLSYVSRILNWYKFSARFQVCSPGVQLSPRLCTFIPRRRALSAGRCRGSSATTFQLVFITDRLPHSSVYRRRATELFQSHVWNILPEHVTFALSVVVFRSRLKTHLFRISYLYPLLTVVSAQ